MDNKQLSEIGRALCNGQYENARRQLTEELQEALNVTAPVVQDLLDRYADEDSPTTGEYFNRYITFHRFFKDLQNYGNLI